ILIYKPIYSPDTIPLHSHSTLFPYTTLFRSEIPLSLVDLEATQRWEKQHAQPGPVDPNNPAPPPAIDPELLKEEADRAALTPERSEEHTSELQSLAYLVCRLLLEKKKNK